MDARTRAIFLNLIDTQAWSRQTVVSHQVRLLEALCRHARDQSRYWGERLSPLFGPDDGFRPDNWEQVPVLTREEAWRNREALGAGKVPESMLPLEAGSTTGSTGTPLPFLRTAASRVMSEAQLARAFTWWGLGALNPVVISKGVRSDVAGRAADAPLPAAKGAIRYVDFVLPPHEQVAQVRAAAPRLIMTYPNIAISWLEAGYDFAGVHCLVLSGETLGEPARARLAAAFSGALIDLYSASEAGPVAIGHPAGGLAVCEENVFLEGPVQAGRDTPHPVVITPLYAYGTPLIRYAPGDYALFAAEPHAGTPGLRRLTALAGRVRNLFRRRDGTTFWPNLSGARLMAIAPHTHRQLIQADFDRFVMRVVFDSPPSPAQIEAIAAHVAEVTGGDRITVEAVAEIADGRQSGKAYEAFVCRV